MNPIQNLYGLFKQTIPPLHKEGQRFVLIFAVATLIFGGLVYEPLGWIGLVLTLWCFYFFRDPIRYVPQNELFIISPADGLIQKIEKAKLPEELGLGSKEVIRISVFLNVFNVHVNRIPVSGKVETLNYHPGKFLSANLEKASDVNERQALVIEHTEGKRVVCVQIAGQIARRIVCELEEGQDVVAGDRYGIIRFGSRVDVYLPENVEPLVTVGQTAIGGETVFAHIHGAQITRVSEAK
jgi:phosphatidylserine decarboxylase